MHAIAKFLWACFKPYLMREVRKLFFHDSPYHY